MAEYPLDPVIREMWKLYPLRIPGFRVSRCCQEPTVLVQSMQGGYVTQNCSKCGGSDTLKQDEFRQLQLWVACPGCKGRMLATIVDLNYAYCCDACDLNIRLADLLPRWSDIV
jgi:hypothetical protein